MGRFLVVYVCVAYSQLLLAEPPGGHSSGGGDQTVTSAPNDLATKLVQQLGDDKFMTRENAQRQLIELGGTAASALREGLKSSDPEIKFRSKRILKAISRDLTCDEVRLAMAEAIKKSSRMAELRDIMDVLRIAGTTDKPGQPSLERLLKSRFDDGRAGRGRINRKRDTGEKEKQAGEDDPVRRLAALLEEMAAESDAREKAQEHVTANFELFFRSQALSEAGVVLRRVEIEVGDPLALVQEISKIGKRNLFAELEFGKKRFELTANDSGIGISDVLDKATGLPETVSVDMRTLFPKTERDESGKTRLLRWPDGRELDAELNPFTGTLELTHTFGSKENGYKIYHTDVDGKPFALESYLSKVFSGFCQPPFNEPVNRINGFNVGVPMTTRHEELGQLSPIERRLSEAHWVPYHGATLKLSEDSESPLSQLSDPSRLRMLRKFKLDVPDERRPGPRL